MSKSITTFVFLFFVCASSLVSPDAFSQCAPAADPVRMDEGLQAYLGGLTSGKSDAVAVLPFFDIFGYQPEPLLPYGMPFLVYDMFAEANPKFIHPYRTLAAVESLGIAGEDLTRVGRVKDVAERLGARLVVFGSVQRVTASEVRVIINIYDAKERDMLSPPVQFSTELNDAFFGLVRERLNEAFRRAKATLKGAKYEDPGMQAFRFYVRGLQLAARYDATSLELASAWFENALKENYHKYDDAALGLARSRFMAALLQKLAKTDFTQNMIQGRQALGYVRTPGGPKVAFVRRHLDGHGAFVNALTALRAGNAAQAEKEAARALALLPEDGMAEEAYWTSRVGAKNAPKFARRAPVCLQ